MSSITLSDITGALKDYVRSVAVTVSDLKMTQIIQTKTCTATFTNADGDDAVDLLNVRVHFKIVSFRGGNPDHSTDKDNSLAKEVAKLIAPDDKGLVCDDNSGTTVKPGQESETGELVIKYLDNRTKLRKGDTLPQAVEIIGNDTGVVHVLAHIHGDPDTSGNPQGQNATGTVEVDPAF